MQKVIDYLQKDIDPTAIYIARRDKIEGMPDADPDDEDSPSNIILKYVAVSPQSQEFMLSKTLGEKEGVTHDVFKKKANDDDDEDSEDDDPDNPKPPKPVPKPGLFLPNVLDNRKVKYFATPKLGSYFAVPITVASYLHEANQTDDLLQNYKEWVEATAQRKVELAQRAEDKARREAELAAQKDEREKAAAEAKAAYEAARDAAIEAGEEPPEPPEAEPEPEEPEPEEEPLEPVPDPRFLPKEVQYVLCIDTLGKGLNCLNEAQMDLLRAIAGLLKDAISRTEKARLYNEMKRQVEEEAANASAMEALADAEKAREEEVAAKLQELQKALDEAAEKAREEGIEIPLEEDAALQEAIIKLSAAQAAVLAMKSKIAELQRYRLPPKGQSVKVLKCVLFTLGYKREDVRDTHTKKMDWGKMKMNFNNEFFTRLQAYDPAGTVADEGKKKKSKKKGKGKKKTVQVIPKYRQTASLLGLIDGIDLDEINSKSVAVGALLEWCKQVLEVRERAKVKLQKEEEIEEARKQKEAEEEAARKQQEEEEAAAAAAAAAEAAEGEEAEES